jgi:Domain of unknown function (DUF4340)
MNGKSLRKHATSIVLVTAALGLGAYVWLVDRDKPSTGETEARKDNLLPILRRDDITEIAIEHDGHKATIVRRDEGDAGDFMFFLVEGDAKADDAAYADQVSVERLLQALEFATRLRKMEGDFDRKAAELEPPNTKLTVRMGSITYLVGIGGEAKMPAGARYAELEGEGVFVIPRAQAEELIRPIDAYRTRRIIPYTSTQLASIEVKSEQGTTRIARGSWGGFLVDNVPGKPRVSQVVFDRMLSAFADATAERFVEAAAANKAVAEAKNTVQLTFVPKEGERAELTLGGACPEQGGAAPANSKLVVLVRKTPTPLYACVPSSVLTDLQMPAIAFAERRAFTTNPENVESIEVTRGDATLELIRKGSGWHVRKPEDREIPSEDVAGYLFGLLSIEGTIVAEPDASKLGLDAPRGTVTLRQPELDAKKVEPQVIEIGAEMKSETGTALALRRKEDGVVLLVPLEADRLLQPTTTLIRSTELLSVSAQRVQKIDVTWSDGLGQVLERDGAGFEMQKPKGYEVDAPLAADLFDAVSRLKAERWVADRDDGSFGLQKPALRLAFEFKDKKSEEKRVLLFGAPTADGRYARWEPDTGVFVLPRSLDMALRTWVIDRSGFMVDPNVVRSVSIRSGSRELRIMAKGNVWETAKGSGIELPPHSLARIQQALIEMRPEGAVHIGAAKADEGMTKPLLRIEVDPLPEARRPKVVITIGRGDVWRTMNVYYARRQGTDATFAIAQSKIRTILELVAPVEP